MRQTGILYRTNSVMSPSAMTTSHMQRDPSQIEGSTAQESKLESFKSQLGHYYYLFALMESSGCRFSEVCQISWLLITSQGKAVVKGKKGSNDRLIFDARCSQFLLKAKSNQFNPFHGCNIFTANRHLHRLGLITQKIGRERLTVTGIFRESFAKEIREVCNDDSKVSELVGHKNKKNGSFYGKG